MGKQDARSVPLASTEARRICQAPVMPIGGAEDKGRGSEILKRFVALASGCCKTSSSINTSPSAVAWVD